MDNELAKNRNQDKFLKVYGTKLKHNNTFETQFLKNSSNTL